jgi:antitoxin YefM
MMNQAISYNQLQNNLEATCHQVCISHTPIFVEKGNGEDFVLLAKEDYLSLMETAYLLKSSANAERLLNSLNHRHNDIIFNSIDELKTQLNLI